MSELGCTCPCDWDVESPKLYKERKVRARKEHVCVECDEPISPGEEYWVIRLLDHDSDWSYWKICQPCMAIGCDLAGYCWGLGNLRNHIKECLGFDYMYTGPEDTEENE
jgi:hypothetical protein